MGTYSYVEVHESVLPEEFKGFIGWQTKDVIEPMFSKLIITEDGRLIHRMSMLGINAKEELSFTGEMLFYTLGEGHDWKATLLCLVATFENGKLVSIKEDV